MGAREVAKVIEFEKILCQEGLGVQVTLAQRSPCWHRLGCGVCKDHVSVPQRLYGNNSAHFSCKGDPASMRCSLQLGQLVLTGNWQYILWGVVNLLRKLFQGAVVGLWQKSYA